MSAARVMKPKASLKSRNTNFLVIASRPETSLQPASLARVLVRSAAVSFWAIRGKPLGRDSATIAPAVPPYDCPNTCPQRAFGEPRQCDATITRKSALGDY